MRRETKGVLLIALFAISVSVSLACGGGGGGGATTSNTPTTATPSPSGTASISPSSSPSPTPIPTPTPTPTPTSYAIEQFAGTWLVTSPGKTDNAPNAGFYFNIDESGSIESEPDTLAYPLVAGGSIVLENTVTGAFSGTIQFIMTAGADAVASMLSGNLSTNRDTLTFDLDANARTATRKNGREWFAGYYSTDIFELINEIDEMLYRSTFSMVLMTSGELTLFGYPASGTWSAFRENWILGSITRNFDVNAFLNGTMSFVLNPNGNHLEGDYEFNGDFLNSTGELKAILLNASVNNFIVSDLAQTWGLSSSPLAQGGRYNQITGFVISAAGIVPTQPKHSITSGSYTFNLKTGYYEMTLYFEDASSTFIRGYISATKAYAYGMNYLNAQADTPYEELRMFKETNNPLWSVSGRDGYWSVVRLPEIIGELSIPAYVFNYRIVNGELENPFDFSSLPIPIDIEISVTGCKLVTAQNQYMLFVNISEPTSQVETVVYVFGTIDPQKGGTDKAGVNFTVPTDLAPLAFAGTGNLQKYNAAAINDQDFTGRYTTNDGVSFNLVYDTSIPFFPLLRADISGTSYILYWLNRPNLLFVLADMTDPQNPVLYGNSFYFFTPNEALYLIGVRIYSNNVSGWALEQAPR